MTIDELLAALADNEIVIYLDGDRPSYRAPEGILTADVGAAIGGPRSGIIDRLEGIASPKMPDPTKYV